MPLVFDTLSSIYGPSNAQSTATSDVAGTGSATVGGAIVGGNQSARTDPATNQSTILGALDNTIFASPVTTWFVIAFAAIGLYYIIHKNVKGVEAEVATPRIGLASFWSVGIMASLFIFLFKGVFSKWRVPGLTEFFGSI